MSPHRTIAVLICAAALALPASAFGSYSDGTPAQIAWVQRAASNFVAAELSGDGASACGILNAPLRSTEHGATCERRWDAKLSKLLREPGARARLRAEQRAIPSSRVTIDGENAWIELATPLMDGSNRLVWSESCWMLAG
jgi:hypothetical protein